MPVALALALPNGYPWVLAAASSISFVNIWQIINVGIARRKAGIKYPQVYATKEEEAASKEAKIFNCTQRAHQNTLEAAHIFVLSTLVGGLRFPRLTVGMAAVYIAGRILYSIGYSSGEPAKRLPGNRLSTVGLLSLVGTSAVTIYQLLSHTGFQI